ncbi:menaquinone-specific isochorismate synthase [Calothrix sp. NIES-4101]|nr:menaquinone-specific isochorismate synthase [Calothrix sp. NIES-4101]
MTNNTNPKTLLQSIKEVPQKIINFIFGGFTRIFTPRDDNYPETGTQPFEGEPADKKHY